MYAVEMFNLSGKVAVVTGGGGALGGAIARGFASAGAKVAVADRSSDRGKTVAAQIGEAGGEAKSYVIDVFEETTIRACRDAIAADFGSIDVLLNAVGGNLKGATTSQERSFFDLPADAIREVMDLNFVGGTVVLSQIFGALMKDNDHGGSIINISSMNAFRPLTRIPG